MNAQDVQNLIERELVDLGKRNGFTIDVAPEREGEDTFLLMLLVDINPDPQDIETLKPSAEEERIRKEKSLWVSLAPLFGFKPEDYGKEFLFRGEAHQVVGFNTRNRKNPLITQRRRDGQRFKWRTETSPPGRTAKITREMLIG